MLYLMKTRKGSSCIVEEKEDGDFTLKAKDMNENAFSSYSVGDTLSSEIMADFLKDKLVYKAEIVSEFENKKVFAEIYKISDLSGCYQVVADGVIRHPDVNAEGAMRAICFYSNA